MSVLIKSMEMPDNCFHCSFCRNDLSSPSRLYVDCTATDSTIIECDYEDSEEAWRKLHDGRQERCPLVEFPAEDVAPVVHGKWEEFVLPLGDREYSCSECGFCALYKELTVDQVCSEYCPNCGARMDKE